MLHGVNGFGTLANIHLRCDELADISSSNFPNLELK
jgi:hypothetical protein